MAYSLEFPYWLHSRPSSFIWSQRYILYSCLVMLWGLWSILIHVAVCFGNSSVPLSQLCSFCLSPLCSSFVLCPPPLPFVELSQFYPFWLKFWLISYLYDLGLFYSLLPSNRSIYFSCLIELWFLWCFLFRIFEIPVECNVLVLCIFL